MALAGRRDVGEHPEALMVMEKAINSLQRTEAEGFKHSILSGVRTFYFRNEQGIIEPGASYTADLVRLGRVASRIVKGLFWKQVGERLPDSCRVSACPNGSMPPNSEQAEQIFDQVMMGEPTSAGRDVFKYWYKQVPEDRFTSAWILQFYGSFRFYCLTINPKFEPSSELPPRSNAARKE